MAFTPTFAARLNSFKSRPDLYREGNVGKLSTRDLIERAASVPGLTQLDLNYPDHLEGSDVAQTHRLLSDCGLSLNGLAMRYYTDPAFLQGAFTHPDARIRQKAIDLTREGIDALAEMGGDLMTIWLGQDGYDYAFHADYDRLWEWELEGVRQAAEHNPDVRISIEYKPNDPRAYSLLSDVGTTLLFLRDVALPNLGVTLDFAHVIYADEQPAASAALVQRHSHLYGVHLNDGYGKRDDGLMVASVHLWQTLELLYMLWRMDYSQVIYFDTFPDAIGLDPVRECVTNISMVRRLLQVVEKIDPVEMDAVLLAQDAIRAQQLIHDALLPELPGI